VVFLPASRIFHLFSLPQPYSDNLENCKLPSQQCLCPAAGRPVVGVECLQPACLLHRSLSGLVSCGGHTAFPEVQRASWVSSS
jgi:hypothetical protein